jgi:DNA repair exonuclease SbcCD nuclease subunit
MKIDILSDLHIDFHIKKRDPKRVKDYVVYDTFCESLNDSKEVEVLIVAGDCGHYNAQDFAVLEAIARVFRYKRIFVTSGNHTLYKSGKHSTLNRITEFWDYESDVVKILNGNVEEYKGIKFGGAMGWAYGVPYINKTLKQECDIHDAIALYDLSMNDMRYIDGLYNPKDMYNVEREKLEAVYKDCDIMVSHYNPTLRLEGVAPEYQFDPISGFYTMDCEDLVTEGSMKYWVYGHQHSRINYKVGDVNVLCNAFGYPGESKHSGKVTIELEK